MLKDPSTFDEAVTAVRRHEAQNQFNDMRNGLSEKQTTEINNLILILIRLEKLGIKTEECRPQSIPMQRGIGLCRQEYARPIRPPLAHLQWNRFGRPTALPGRPFNQPQRQRWTDRSEPVCRYCHRPGY